MEENITVAAPAPEAAEPTVFAFAEGMEAIPVDGGEEPAEEQETEVSEQVAAEEPAEEVDAPAETTEPKQKDISKAFKNEKRRIEERERAKYQKAMSEDPIRNLGLLMVNDLVQTKEISEEEAVKEVTDNFLKAIAKREGITPALARKLYGPQVKREIKQATSEEKTAENDVERIVREVEAAPKPEGFDEEKAYKDPAFIELLTEMPAAAAIRVYHAEQKASNAEASAAKDIAEKLKSRQRVPQMSKAQQPVTPAPDWRKVDSDAFFAEKERRKRMMR